MLLTSLLRTGLEARVGPRLAAPSEAKVPLSRLRLLGGKSPGEVALDGWPDGLNQFVLSSGGGARHLEDVTGEHQAAQVRADERRSQFTLVLGHDAADRPEQP
jgi:hypothetical protein